MITAASGSLARREVFTRRAGSLTTLRQTVKKKPELLEKVLKSMIEGISIFKTNKEKTYRFGANISGARATTFWRKPINSTLGELERVPIRSL